MDSLLEKNYIFWVQNLELNSLYTEISNIDFLVQYSKDLKVLDIASKKRKILEKEYKRRKK